MTEWSRRRFSGAAPLYQHSPQAAGFPQLLLQLTSGPSTHHYCFHHHPCASYPTVHSPLIPSSFISTLILTHLTVHIPPFISTKDTPNTCQPNLESNSGSVSYSDSSTALKQPTLTVYRQIPQAKLLVYSIYCSSLNSFIRIRICPHFHFFWRILLLLLLLHFCPICYLLECLSGSSCSSSFSKISSSS